MKQIISIFLALFICNNLNAQRLYETASYEYFNGDLSKSIELFTKSIKANEELPKSYMYRGAAQIFLGNYVNAVYDLDISFKLDSLNKDIFFYYGKLYLLQHQLDKALYYYNAAIEKDHQFANAYGERSNTKFLMGDFQGAIHDDSMAILLKPNEASLYNQRGYSKLKLKRYKEAILDFEMSIKLKVNQKAYTNAGLAYSLIGDHNKAIENYTKALNIVSNDGETLYLQGISYKALGLLDNACQSLIESKKLGYSAALEILNEIQCK